MEMNSAAALDLKPSPGFLGRRAAASFTRSQRSEHDPAAVPTRVDRDRGLVEALRRGESTAPERFVTAYGDRAYRLALRITGTPQDAEEVVQDAVGTVIRRSDTVRGDAALGSWFY